MNEPVPTKDWAEDLVLELAQGERGVRLLGGRAVRYHVLGKVPDTLVRPPGDVDLFTVSEHRRDVQQWLESMGLRPEKEFNLLNGRSRLMYWRGKEKIDVFIDEFAMCHALDLRGRLPAQDVTLPVADLMLTKLQVVEFTEKDMRDVLALLSGVPFVDRDEPGAFNTRFFADTLARDWGLWRTVTRNLDVLLERLQDFVVEASLQLEIEERIRQLTEVVERTPKTMKWKWRAAVGERLKWYELPEEP
ncbi:hypothetical protein [Kyrpidia spormannii]|uniref:Uncharacterized protein n=1 Tax=Kyrpidia spormannii TaxID=2055160 RepID=A0ACA8Z875_9BACL|nr:hypothetical protein [Kyrpidia spormannii]CAB3391354.1 conserved protein of unknown function [Kyrpidia spormannii]